MQLNSYINHAYFLSMLQLGNTYLFYDDRISKTKKQTMCLYGQWTSVPEII